MRTIWPWSPATALVRPMLRRNPRLRLPALSTWILFLGLAGCQEPTEDGIATVDSPASARAETVTEVDVFPDEFTATLSCTDEEVTWTGRVVLVFHTTYNRGVPPAPDNFQHRIEVNAVHYTGTGLSSGDTYQYNATFQNSLQSPDTDSPFPTTETLTVRERIIGPTGLLGFATFKLRFVLSGSGEVRVELVEIDEECR